MDAQQDYQDSGHEAEITELPVKGISKSAPPQYAVLRAGSQQPEPLRALSDEEAWATIQRQVRIGQVSTIHLYKLVGAEVYEASSKRLSAEDLATPSTERESNET